VTTEVHFMFLNFVSRPAIRWFI